MDQTLREDLKRRVREANDIVDVIGAAVSLKRAGKNYKALCPFHNEKTPSFIVNPERQTFKCFGCGEGGDVFTFVEKHERVEFREALEILAERAGIALDVSPAAAGEAALAKERKLHLYRAQELAAKYFVERLRSPEGIEARAYLERRKLAHLAGSWGLGYAPESWDGFTGKYATSPSKMRWLVAAGLAKERESGGVYDIFRGRLMFPIRDASGRIAGFGGRVLGEGEPKYLNTPETAIFAKGRLLYGLDRARRAIDSTGEALVVEGYTDVIRCHEKGFENAVATLGTALGPEHLRLLRRFGARRVLVVYDADESGIRAAERALEVLIEEDMAGAVVSLDGGLDPCDFLDSRPAEDFARAVSGARDLFEFKIARVVEGRDLSDLNARVEAARELMELASRAQDPVRRALLRKRVSEALRVPEEALAFARVVRRERGEGAPGLDEAPADPESVDRRAERDLAWLLARYPAGLQAARAEAELGFIKDSVAREIIEAVSRLSERGAVLEGRAILDGLSPEAVRFAVDALEERDGASPERLAERVRKAAVALRLRQIASRLESLSEEIRAAGASGNSQRVKELTRERMELCREAAARRDGADPDARRHLAALRERASRRPRARSADRPA